MKSSTIFKNIFLGEFVELVANIRLEEGTGFNVIAGYLLDVDDDFYYLGHSSELVSDGIRKDAVMHISIISPKSKNEELLESLPQMRAEDGN